MPFALDVLSLVLGFVFGAGIVLLLRSGGIGQAEAGRLAAEADFTLRQNDDLRTDAIQRERLPTGLRAELGDARTVQAQLQTRLEQERLASAEKIALPERAEAKLSDAFK